jgi:hypothetical protein
LASAQRVGGDIVSGRRKVLFFSPYAGIWPHALPESFLAKALDPESFEVSRVSCDGTFSAHCTAMSAGAVGIERPVSDKLAVCAVCVSNRKILEEAYPGGTHMLSRYLDKEDTARVESLLTGLSEENIQDLEFEGIEVGRIAAYEILIKFKKTSLTFHGEEFRYLRSYVRSSLLSLLAFRRIFAQLKPDVFVAYSPQYGMIGVCARYCELQGIPVYFVEGSSNINERYQALRIWNWTEFGLTNPALRYWKDVDQYEMSSEDRQRALAHTQCLLSASSFSVYSAPVSGRSDVRSRFGIPADAPLMLAAMSSYDEVFSAFAIGRFPSTKYDSDVFQNQLAWIEHTVGWFAKHPDLYLIIRIHPRTFPSKRNSVMAAEQLLLAKLLDALPPNVRVNYPAENISIYDAYGEIDALVTGWSATGVEAMTFGVPVVTYDSNLPSYPAEIHYTGRSREEYEANLVKALESGRNDANIENGYRWMTFSMSLGVVRHPPLFRYATRIANNRLLRYGVRALEIAFPWLVKRLEARRRLRMPAEIARVRRMIINGGRSLYDT